MSLLVKKKINIIPNIINFNGIKPKYCNQFKILENLKKNKKNCFMHNIKRNKKKFKFT